MQHAKLHKRVSGASPVVGVEARADRIGISRRSTEENRLQINQVTDNVEKVHKLQGIPN